MILESWPWKRELLDHANAIIKIRKRLSFIGTGEKELQKLEFRLERAIFYSAYIIRKLIENGKLTDVCATQKVDVAVYDSKPRKLSIRDFYSLGIGRNFEDVERNRVMLRLDALMSEIIHSFLLVWKLDDEGLTQGMFLSSYKNKSKRAILLGFDRFDDILRSVAKDEVVESHFILDPKQGKFFRKNS